MNRWWWLAVVVCVGCSDSISGSDGGKGGGSSSGGGSAVGGGGGSTGGGSATGGGTATGGGGTATGGGGSATGGGGSATGGGGSSTGGGGSATGGGGAATGGGGSATGGGGAATGGGGGGGSTLSAGCGKTGMPTGMLQGMATVQGVARTYTFQIPSSYNPNTALPEIFVFHGAGSSSAGAIAMGLQNANGADQAIYLFPDAKDFTSDAGVDYGVGWDQSCIGFDIPFVAAMESYVETNYCIDTHRRFMTGFSWGGDMVDALICCQGNQWRAAAVASGDEMDYNPTSSGVSCANVSRPAFRITYGSGDSPGNGDGSYLLQQFTDEVTFMRTALSCASTSTAVTPSPCVQYDGCTKPVIECNYPHLGHTLPSDWAQQTWNFFSTFP